MKTEVKNKTISIALATDERYLAPTLVVIHSLVKRSKELFNYDIYILSEEKLSFPAERCLHSAAGKHKNVKIKLITVGKRLNSLKLSSNGPIKGVTATTYLRFLLPELLPGIQRILYMDVDTVVLGDVAEIFNLETGDCCVAGVRDIAGFQNKTERCAELNIPDLDHYINAGVLLMDLETFRKDRLSDIMITAANKKAYTYNDQDIINSVCYNRIFCIPFRCNAIVDYLNHPEVISKEMGNDYLTETAEPIILHYAGRSKPWYFPENKWSSFWWEVVKSFNMATRVMFRIYLNRLL